MRKPVTKKLSLILVFVVIVSAFCALAVPYRYVLLTKVGQFLVVRQRPAKAGFLYVLGGDFFVRVPEAVKLYREGWAPLIVIPRERINDSVRNHQGIYQTAGTMELLAQLGVAPRNIIEYQFKDGVSSTADEARALKQLASQMPQGRILVVTSAFHSRRASLAMGRALSSQTSVALLVPVEDPRFTESSWWKVPEGRHQVGLEYIKLFYYTLAFWP